ncbi:MAG: flavin reductase family protein [Fervidobacterium sp.]
MIFVEKPERYYFHYPFPVAIVGVTIDEKVNFMSAAWHTQLSFSPPLYGVAISPKRYTNELLKKSEAFSLSFLKFEDYKISGFVGRTSGWNFEKTKIFGINYTKGRNLDVPILDNAIACYECKVVDSRTYGDHILYVGEILGVHYDEHIYRENLNTNLLLYLGSDTYTSANENKCVKFGREEVDDELRKIIE